MRCHAATDSIGSDEVLSYLPLCHIAERMNSEVDALFFGVVVNFGEGAASFTSDLRTVQPTAFLGSFDEAYLKLPVPVLITVMKKHQRYFPVVGERREDGAAPLLPYFVGVRNGGPAHLDIVRQGNENVLRARYADANFFFKADTGVSKSARISAQTGTRLPCFSFSLNSGNVG